MDSIDTKIINDEPLMPTEITVSFNKSYTPETTNRKEKHPDTPWDSPTTNKETPSSIGVITPTTLGNNLHSTTLPMRHPV
jgi:hypothetical protein